MRVKFAKKSLWCFDGSFPRLLAVLTGLNSVSTDIFLIEARNLLNCSTIIQIIRLVHFGLKIRHFRESFHFKFSSAIWCASTLQELCSLRRRSSWTRLIDLTWVWIFLYATCHLLMTRVTYSLHKPLAKCIWKIYFGDILYYKGGGIQIFKLPKYFGSS